MTALRFRGIPSTLADEVRTTMKSPQYGHPAHRDVATSYGPCRVCLRTFETGKEERILFTYQPFRDGALPAPGPVFVHSADCAEYDAAELPADFRSLPLVFEGYASRGKMLAQEHVGDRNPDVVLAELFRQGDVEYAHVRNAAVGCFMARVERAA